MKKAASEPVELEKHIWKTFNVEVIDKAEEEKIFSSPEVKTFKCEIKGNPVDETRTMVVKISTNLPDRSNDVMDMKGIVLDNYLKNPVVSAFHKYDRPSAGRALLVGVAEDHIVSKMEFPPEGVNPEADILHKLYTTGFQSGVSIGFIPHEAEYNDMGGRNFKSWELLEYALVLVPDNAGALRMSLEKGFDPDTYLAESKKFFEAQEQKSEDEQQPEEVVEEETATEETPAEEVTEEIKEEETPASEEEAPAETEEETKGITDETKVAELTVAQLKSIVTPQVEMKDVSQVTSLSYVLSDLQFIAYMFGEDKVSQSTLDKVNQAIAILLSAVQEQAVLGKKEYVRNGEHKEDKPVEKKEQANQEVPTPSPLLARLATSLKATDKEVGLTLRLLKEIKQGTGGEK